MAQVPIFAPPPERTDPLPRACTDGFSTPRPRSSFIMNHVKEIVERVADAMGPSADPSQVEAVVSSLLETSATAPAISGACLRISLADCSSLLTATVRARAYDKIRRIASHLQYALDDSGLGGAQTIAAAPAVTELAGKATGPDLVVLSRMFDDAARDCSAAEIVGVTASADTTLKGVSAALTDVIPEILQTTSRVVVDVRAASRSYGISIDAVKAAMASARRFCGPREDLLRLRVSGGPPARAFTADAAVLLTADAGRMIEAALHEAPDAPVEDVASVLSAAAFGLGRSLAQRASRAAEVIRKRSGFDVYFGGVTVDPGTGIHPEPAFAGALAAAIAGGFRAAVGASEILPRRAVVAFTMSTDTEAAAGYAVRELAHFHRRAVALHPIFADRRPGDLLGLGIHGGVLVKEPHLEAWHRRGGRIPPCDD